MRVRIPSGYPRPFCFDLGQSGVSFDSGPLVRGSALVPALDAITFVRANHCELMHTLNAVPVRRRLPWISTFESYMPRVPDDRYSGALERFLVRRLQRYECKRLVAFSQYAMRQFERQIARCGTPELLEKAEVLYPAAPPVEQSKTIPEGELKLLFVGRQFLHKGGPAVVRAHELLRRSGLQVTTTVVSRLDWDPKGLVGPPARHTADSEHAKLADCAGITHFRELSNERVRELMRESHFLLLPTVNDTFGFACLEALAHGVPVIATATCAMPEIVRDGGNGRLLEMPVDEMGRWTGLARRREKGYDRLYIELMEDLGDQIARTLKTIEVGSAEYAAMREEAARSASDKFDRDSARRRLEEIYSEAVA